MLGRIVKSADFERVLGTPARRRSVHFALHHSPGPAPAELSTSDAAVVSAPVDDLAARWFGVVVPKRHAKRSVTRSLLKRQMRSFAQRHVAELAPGWWVLRLKAPFDKKLFESAASEPLRRLAHQELDGLLGRPSVRSRPA